MFEVRNLIDCRGNAEPQGDLILVGNIHVLFNPKRGDIKLGQVLVGVHDSPTPVS